MWGIWVSYDDITKAIFYLLKGDYNMYILGSYRGVVQGGRYKGALGKLREASNNGDY